MLCVSTGTECLPPYFFPCSCYRSEFFYFKLISMNIYISRFDLQWKNIDLENLFTPYGDVSSAEISIDGFTDKSRGFGYVEMPDEEQAKKAIAALNKTVVAGHELSVQKA